MAKRRSKPPRTFQDLIFALQNVLVGSGLRHPAALRHGNGRGHLPYRDLSARRRPGALERGLRAALAAAHRRPLRRQSVPPAALLPISGLHQALARRFPGAVPGIAALARLRSADARHPLRRGQLGIPDARAPGDSAGRCGSTAWRSRSSPTSSRSAAWIAGRSWARSPTVSSASPCTSKARRASSISCGRDGPFGTVTYGDVFHQNEVEQSAYNFEKADTRCCCASSTRTKRPASACSRTNWCCRPTNKWSRPRMPSICSMRGARSRSPSASASSCACAPWRAPSPRPIGRAAKRSAFRCSSDAAPAADRLMSAHDLLFELRHGRTAAAHAR